jgi:predicted PurR-regulated permease PerM
MPMTQVFLGMLGGFITFGFLGMFIGPSLLALSFALPKAWQRPPKRAAAATSTRGNAPS